MQLRPIPVRVVLLKARPQKASRQVTHVDGDPKPLYPRKAALNARLDSRCLRGCVGHDRQVTLPRMIR